MTQAEQWLRHPQNVWLRRAVFQIHLWSGLILGIYAFLVSVSGSAIVFRNEFLDVLSARTIVKGSGKTLTREQLTEAAERTYPGYTVRSIRLGRFAEEATDIVLVDGWRRKDRLFDPFRGRDIGPSVETYFSVLHWVGDLHGNLLLGRVGLRANGVGGFLVAILCVSGMIVWWPGITGWRRSVTIRRDVGWKRLNWDLHSALGFWTVALILMWALTGAYFVFPDPFRAVINPFTQIDPPLTKVVTSPAAGSIQVSVRRSPRPRTTGQKILRGFSAAHYGNFGGWPVKVLWVILGFAAPALFVTSVLMWWNRVLGPAARRFLGDSRPALKPEIEERRSSAA